MNNPGIKWSDWTRSMERFLRLKTFPVGLKMLEDSADLSANPWLRKPQEKLSLCQLITIVRTFDWTVGGTADDLVTPGCASVLGLAELPEFVKDGSMRNVVWLEKKHDAALCESIMQRIPCGKYKAFMLAPTSYDPFIPDIVLIYANPAQMSLMVNAIQYDKFERLVFYSVGESSCSDVIGRCFVDRVPALVHPLLRRTALRPCLGRGVGYRSSRGGLSQNPCEFGDVVQERNPLSHLALRGPSQPIPGFGGCIQLFAIGREGRDLKRMPKVTAGKRLSLASSS